MDPYQLASLDLDLHCFKSIGSKLIWINTVHKSMYQGSSGHWLKRRAVAQC